jgi:hypothetical protein
MLDQVHQGGQLRRGRRIEHGASLRKSAGEISNPAGME